MRVSQCVDRLRLPWHTSRESRVVQIQNPCVSIEGDVSRIGTIDGGDKAEERSKDDVRRSKREGRKDAQRTLTRASARECSPTLSGAKDRALIAVVASMSISTLLQPREMVVG